MNPAIILFLIAIILAVWIIGIYNRLIRKRTLVQEGWSGVDVQLKRRTDLIPNLIGTVKGYMTHEQKLLSDVTALRAKSMAVRDVGEKGDLENSLSRSLASLFAVAESYPDLKANQNFQDLQNQLSLIETEIQMARRYYNGTVRNLNILVDSFPGNLVANFFDFRKADFFQIDEPDRAVPNVKF